MSNLTSQSPQLHLFTPQHTSANNNNNGSTLNIASSPALTALAQIVTDSNHNNNDSNNNSSTSNERSTGISILRLNSANDDNNLTNNSDGNTTTISITSPSQSSADTSTHKHQLDYEHHEPASALLDIMSSPTQSSVNTHNNNHRRYSHPTSNKKMKSTNSTYNDIGTPNSDSNKFRPDMSPLSMNNQSTRSPPTHSLNHHTTAPIIQQQVITTSSGRKSVKPLPSHATTMLSSIQSLHSSEPGGSSCHQCKSRRAYGDLTYCTSSSNKKSANKSNACRKKYCDHCLKKFYRELPVPASSNQSWACPSCRKICCCAACRRREVHEPNDDNNNTLQSNQPDYYNTGMVTTRFSLSSPQFNSNNIPGLPPMHNNNNTVNGRSSVDYSNNGSTSNTLNGVPSTMISMLSNSIDSLNTASVYDSNGGADDSDAESQLQPHDQLSSKQSFASVANTFAWFYSISQIPDVNAHIHSILNQNDITNEYKVKLVENVLCDYVADVASNKIDINTTNNNNESKQLLPIKSELNTATSTTSDGTATTTGTSTPSSTVTSSKPPPLIDPDSVQ